MSALVAGCDSSVCHFSAPTLTSPSSLPSASSRGGAGVEPAEPGLGVQLWATALPPPRPPHPLQELEA